MFIKEDMDEQTKRALAELTEEMESNKVRSVDRITKKNKIVEKLEELVSFKYGLSDDFIDGFISALYFYNVLSDSDVKALGGKKLSERINFVESNIFDNMFEKRQEKFEDDVISAQKTISKLKEIYFTSDELDEKSKALAFSHLKALGVDVPPISVRRLTDIDKGNSKNKVGDLHLTDEEGNLIDDKVEAAIENINYKLKSNKTDTPKE